MHDQRDARVATRQTCAKHSRVHLVHDPLALHRRDGRSLAQGAQLGVHLPGDRVHDAQHVVGVQVEVVLPDGGHDGERLVRDDRREVPGRGGGRVERTADQGGGHEMLAGPRHPGVKRPAGPAASQSEVEEVQRPAATVCALVPRHRTRGRVQLVSQERTATVAVVDNVRLGLEPVYAQAVLVETGQHGV